VLEKCFGEKEALLGQLKMPVRMKYVPRFFLSDKCFSTTLEEERPFVSSLDLKSYGLFENRNNIYHPRGIQ
jgi:hypothetical protein